MSSRIVVVGILLLCSELSAADSVFYFNAFDGPVGSTFPEWSSSGYTYTGNKVGTISPGGGPQPAATVGTPNHKQRFLGEFGGPAIVTAPPYDPNHFVRVDETVSLALTGLPVHSSITVDFDLYVLKSWDGNNPNYGPDRWALSVAGGPTLSDTTFSNNFKTDPYDLSLQNYPVAGSLPQTGAVSNNTLGYSFYGDSIYHLSYTFAHQADILTLDFSSSMFEGKGTDDESWGLDNVRVSTDAPVPEPRYYAFLGMSLILAVAAQRRKISGTDD